MLLSSLLPVTKLGNKLSLFNFTDINDCVNHTCQNGGSCVDGVNNFTCNCLKGYTGSHCQTGIPRYLLIDTLNNFTCTFKVTLILEHLAVTNCPS